MTGGRVLANKNSGLRVCRPLLGISLRRAQKAPLLSIDKQSMLGFYTPEIKLPAPSFSVKLIP